MNLINRIDKRFSIGLILGLVFGLLSVYVDFFKSSDPELTFNVLSNATVFDIKEDIGKLDVLYDSTSLTKQGKIISLITIKISNSGNGSILKEYFDSIYPLRLFIDSAKIVQNPQLIETNEVYLNKSVNFRRFSENGFIINPFIFDRGKFFVIKLLVIHKQGFTPSIKAYGKIARIDKFDFFSSFDNHKKESFWPSVFYGSFIIHVTRFFTYLFSLVIFVVLLVLPISMISDSVSKKNRKKMLKIFRKVYNKTIEDNHEILIDFYLDNGIVPIERFKRIIDDQNRFKHLFSLVNEENDFYFAKHNHHNPMDTSVGYLIRELEQKEIIKIENKKFSIDENFKIFLFEFIKFMKE